MLGAGVPLPITLITGFLGAGKTTLLNALLKSPSLAGAAVIINEFGEIGVDHLLVEAVEGDMLLLATGCICCAARGDLMNALAELVERRRAGRIAFGHIIVETTGIADPAPIINAVMLDPALSASCRLESVVTVVDAVGGAAVLDRHPEAERQVAVADVLVLSKTDLLATEHDGIRDLERRIEVLNPMAQILRSCDTGSLVTALAGQPFRLPAQRRGYASVGHAHIQATSLRAGALDLRRLADFVHVLMARCGPKLLRLKGIVAATDDPARPVVVHAVQHMIHPAMRLAAWPDGDRSTRMVVITQDFDAAQVLDLWDAFFGPPGIDRPDAAALSRSGERVGGLF